LEADVTTFQLGAISFNDGIEDADGITWWGYVDGWDTTEMNVEDYRRPAVHGAITTSNLYAARQMTLFATAAFTAEACAVESTVPDIYYIARDKLDDATAAFTQFAEPQLVLVHNEDVDRELVVYRTSLRTRCLGGVAMEIELTLRADDPVKSVVGS
jgi:hypothetical protein